MENLTKGLFDLFLMFLSAKLAGEICERIRQPAVVGEIIAGILLGPQILDLVSVTELNSGIAEIGVIVLLFTVGLESKPAELFRIGGLATLVAIGGVVLPFIGGYFYMLISGHNQIESIFIGAALVATSVGITARVLSDLQVINQRASQVILGAAVIDDIIGMLVLALVSSLSSGRIEYLKLLLVTLEVIGFIVFLILIGRKMIKHISGRMRSMKTRNAAFAFALLLCLGFSAGASYIGMAAIIGAFLAGLLLSEESEELELGKKAGAIYDFLVPFFFVVMGMNVDIQAIFRREILILALIITFIAIIGKLIGCGVAAIPLGFKDAFRIGVGMVPRGEVGIIVALVGMKLHTISTALYSVVIFMSLATTLLTPPILRGMFSKKLEE